MCYDISYKTDVSGLFNYLPSLEVDGWTDQDFEDGIHRQAHAHLSQPVIIFEDGKYKAKFFEWGLIAGYMNTNELVKKNRAWMCNARSEKIHDKKSYWYKIRNQRCLVPVTGIYEHRSVKGMKTKVPYYIRWKEREMFCLPGFYNYSPIPDSDTGEIKGTFTIITRGANELMQLIHNDGENKFRMPLFLPKDLELLWLNPDITNEQIEKILSYEVASSELEAWPVFKLRTTKPRPDNRLRNEPFEWQGLPPLGNDEVAGQQNLF